MAGVNRRRWGLVFALGCAALAAQNEEIRWKKTVAPDRSFSLHYPSAWSAVHNASTVALKNDPGGEQMIVLRLPRDQSKQPAAYVQQIAELFRKSDPNFRVADVQTQGQNAGFHLQYSPNYVGLGVVFFHPSTVFWVSYASLDPSNLRRGGTLLTAVAQSIADNADSPMPGPVRVAVASRGNGSAPSVPAPTRSPQSTGGGTATLIGQWSTSGYYGEYVDRQGSPVVRAYSSEQYTFRPDGTYHYVIVGSGNIISGVSMTDGTYEFSGNQLHLHQRTENWYPFPQSANRT